MTANPEWSGEIDAKQPEGCRTGIYLKAGQVFSAGAKGWVKRGKESETLAGPQGVAGRSDSAVVLKGRIGDSEFITGNYLINFVAPAEGELSFFVADGNGKYIDNSGSFHVDVYLANADEKPFEDLTDFSGGSWNDWKPGDATTRASLANASLPVLQLMTYPEEKNAGTVVQKRITGLKEGKTYYFSVRATRIIGKYKEPRLSLRADGQDITPVTTLTSISQWVTIEGSFTAKGDSADLSVISHEKDSMGNDYQIRELKVCG